MTKNQFIKRIFKPRNLDRIKSPVAHLQGA